MGDAAGQRADGLHFLGLMQLLLQPVFMFLACLRSAISWSKCWLERVNCAVRSTTSVFQFIAGPFEFGLGAPPDGDFLGEERNWSARFAGHG